MTQLGEYSLNKYFFTKIILCYLFVTHIVPGFFFEIINFKYIEPSYIHVTVPVTFFSISIVPFVILTTFLIEIIFLSKEKHAQQMNNSKKAFFFNKKIVINLLKITSVLFFVFGFFAFLYLDRSWRYSSEGISESSSFGLTILLAIIPNVLKILFFYNIFVENLFKRINKLYSYSFLAAIFLNSNGTGTLLIFFIAILYFIFPKLFDKVIFFKKTPISKKIYRFMFVSTALILIILGSFIIGENIKTKTDNFEISEQVDFSNSEQLKAFSEYLVIRTSAHYISTKVAMYYLTEDLFFAHWFKNLSFFFQNMAFRFTKILGLDYFEKPSLSSVARINYSMITPPEILTERQGTHPGPIAGFFYMFPTPLNWFFFVIYLYLLCGVFNRFNRKIRAPLSFIGIILFIFWLITLLEGPLDLLVIIDDSFLSLLLILFLSNVKPTVSTLLH